MVVAGFLIAHSRSGFKKMKAPTKKIMQKLTYYGIQEIKSEILRDEQRDEQDRDEHISFYWVYLWIAGARIIKNAGY